MKKRILILVLAVAMVLGLTSQGTIFAQAMGEKPKLPEQTSGKAKISLKKVKETTGKKRKEGVVGQWYRIGDRNIEMILEEGTLKMIEDGEVLREIKAKKYHIATFDISGNGEVIAVVETLELESAASKVYFYDFSLNEIGSFEDKSLRALAGIKLSENGRFAAITTYDRLFGDNTENHPPYVIVLDRLNNSIWKLNYTATGNQISNDGNILVSYERLYKRGSQSYIGIGGNNAIDNEGSYLLTCFCYPYLIEEKRCEFLDIKNKVTIWSYKLTELLDSVSNSTTPAKLIISESEKYSILIFVTDLKGKSGRIIIINKNGRIIADEIFNLNSNEHRWARINSMSFRNDKLTIINNEKIYEYEIIELTK